ncbi:hypothetical protein [Naasia lichenicola]|uniref:Uncharacterized protein n=1 Tax=Naasia lichenicola TaxID=2565933 RepID=A0A4S4FIF5_9MICO|nr:hypothetical protein [Naasia lichenicola]THG30123.1 hypothetical protein E6C64_15940 [Naasia lichenicola]
MRHITFGDKSLLMGDEAAQVLVDYAAALTNAGRADSVEMRAIGTDGNDVNTDMLLDSSTSLMSETATTVMEEPDNAAVVEYMRRQMALIDVPPVIVSTDLHDPSDFPDFDQPTAILDGR